MLIYLLRDLGDEIYESLFINNFSVIIESI